MRDGFRDYEISVLAFAWIVPLLSRAVAGATGIPLGLLALIVLFCVTMRRALLDRKTPAFGAARVAQA